MTTFNNWMKNTFFIGITNKSHSHFITNIYLIVINENQNQTIFIYEKTKIPIDVLTDYCNWHKTKLVQ